MNRIRTIGSAVSTAAVCLALAGPARGQVRKVERPYLFMNRADVAAAKRLIAAADWARAEVERVRAARGWGTCHRNLFRHLVLGDVEARDAEKAYLLSFIGAPVDRRPWSDNYENALRYDALYESLSADERRRVEETFRAHVGWQLAQDKRVYRKHNWLPNMQWCRAMGIFLMAAALGDEKLIDACFRGNGGWKYYFDDYVSDGYFYNEEFGKQYSMIGEMLFWCRGCEALGLDRYGYGYTGSGGATMRKYLESIYLAGMPRVDLGTDRPHYPKMTMGDAKGKCGLPGYAFQHPIVTGYLADGRGGDERFMGSNMNGRDHKDRIVSKLMRPLWFEIAHRKWPDAGFDYFLAQMRRPDQDKYHPSLYFGCGVIDEAKVQPPAVPSGVWPERGIAILRAEEGRGFWESPAPCVGLRLATPYVHEVPDCFSLMGLYAFNRPLYVNRQVSSGYAGTDPGWSNSIRSHSSVMVDNLEPRRIGIVPTRHRFGRLAKFVAARARGIYPDVDQTRALALTNEYLFDVFALASPRPRSYLWTVQTLGHTCPDNPGDWVPTRHLVGSVYDLGLERSCFTSGEDWAVTACQATAGADPATSGLGERWFAGRCGVRVHMLGEPGTVAYTAVSPATAQPKDRISYAADEPGGAGILAARNAARTMFVALHEPFKDTHRVVWFRKMGQADDAVAVGVHGLPGSGIDDRVMVRFGDEAATPVTLNAGSDKFTFTGFAFIRVGADRVDVEGDLAAMRLLVGGRQPPLFVNGKQAACTIDGGLLYYGKRFDAPMIGKYPRRTPQPGPIAARWFPRLLCLPAGGKGAAALKLRNNGLAAATARLVVHCPADLTAEPKAVDVRDLPPGGERTVTVTIAGLAGPEAADRPHRLYAAGEGDVPVQPAELLVANGVARQWRQVWPRDFSWTIYSPRYVVRYCYLTSVAAGFLLDPAGHGRRSRQADSFPRLYLAEKDDQGRWSYRRVALGGFQAFRPGPRREADGTRFFADMGEHPHGYRSPFEHRFTDDWISVRYKDAKDGQKIVIDFWSDVGRSGAAAVKWPPVVLYAADGKIHEGGAPRRGLDLPAGQAVDAVFRRPAGYEFGEVCLYPKHSVADRRYVVQPGAEAMAFTFARGEDLAALVAKWRSSPAPTYVKPWGQGDMGR